MNKYRFCIGATVRATCEVSSVDGNKSSIVRDQVLVVSKVSSYQGKRVTRKPKIGLEFHNTSGLFPEEHFVLNH